MIKNIPKEYFQKSKIFLYPILGIPRGNNFIPVNTYVAWNNKIVKEEFSFLCVYNIVDSQEYRDFELKYLFDNKRFKGFYYLEDNKGVYIFDFTDFTDDYLLFLGSNYSQMSNQIKKILGFLSASIFLCANAQNNAVQNYDIVMGDLKAPAGRCGVSVEIDGAGKFDAIAVAPQYIVNFELK
jgi:hypothetical protein